ncbi:MAG: InlB B-repeat-containing protein, partial [Bacilli bacterium]|nr:InlB B-repeat-containing protein [Bacilli bacterium]
PKSYSLLDNHVRVNENSELTYYLDMIYDGKDKNLVMSSDDAVADVRSDSIYIEDKIPDGLIFIGFVNSSDGSIGAVRRSDGTTTCGGYIVDGVSGLKYNEDTRTVSFRIKNLQAGCKITIGIITKTPFLGNSKRMDFYNTAFGRENSVVTNSNTVHVFMGRENEPVYKVSYSYVGDVPENAPGLPEEASYAEGTKVGTINDISVPGYTFSGWQSDDVTISNSSFTMPAKEVVIKGQFTKNQVYKVSYSITGGVQPEEYTLPKEKEYSAGEEVRVDSLKAGDVISGYRFLGWQTESVTVNDDGVFTMPTQAVQLVGQFEQVTYKVTYQFKGSTIPANAAALLPAEKSYFPGQMVSLEPDPVATGYEFLGWYKTSAFEMPEEDVVIYGEWMQNAGSFTPTITKTIANPSGSGYYHSGDKVQFTITVTNTAAFPITDVMLQQEDTDSNFVSGTGYTLLNSSHVRIDTIPANSSINVQAEYTVGNQPQAEITKTVSLTGALADNNYLLDRSKTYQASATFNVINTSLEVILKDPKNVNLEGAEFTLCEDAACTQVVKTGLLFDHLLPNKTYYLKETKAPNGYVQLQ